MNMHNLIVLGAGGHAKVVVGTLESLGKRACALYDDDLEKVGMKVMGVEVLGAISGLNSALTSSAVAAIGNNEARKTITEGFNGFEWLTVIHPMAYVHPSVKIGNGTVVFAGAIIQPGAVIGEHCIINTGAVVEHDCVLEDFAHVAPGSKIAGGVRIGEGTLIGIGVSIVPKVKIGEWTIVGAGGSVVCDLPSRVKAYGVPARIING